MKYATTAMVQASARHGKNDSRRQTKPSFLKATVSIPSPAFSRIMTRDILRSTDDQVGKMSLATSMCGTLYRMNPIISIPVMREDNMNVTTLTQPSLPMYGGNLI